MAVLLEQWGVRSKSQSYGSILPLPVPIVLVAVLLGEVAVALARGRIPKSGNRFSDKNARHNNEQSADLTQSDRETLS
jgi:hypothetical protein